MPLITCASPVPSTSPLPPVPVSVSPSSLAASQLLPRDVPLKRSHAQQRAKGTHRDDHGVLFPRESCFLLLQFLSSSFFLLLLCSFLLFFFFLLLSFVFYPWYQLPNA